jgi:hypothetical protein
MDSTAAKIGRSMKKRENKVDPQLFSVPLEIPRIHEYVHPGQRLFDRAAFVGDGRHGL